MTSPTFKNVQKRANTNKNVQNVQFLSGYLPAWLCSPDVAAAPRLRHGFRRGRRGHPYGSEVKIFARCLWCPWDENVQLQAAIGHYENLPQKEKRYNMLPHESYHMEGYQDFVQDTPRDSVNDPPPNKPAPGPDKPSPAPFPCHHIIIPSCHHIIKSPCHS